MRHQPGLRAGPEALMAAALATDDLQWRLELCGHLLALKQPAETLKATTLRLLAEREINATARNT